MKNKRPIGWKAIMLLAAGITAAMIAGCGTTPSGIVISAAGQYRTMNAGAGKKRPAPHSGVDLRKPKGSPVFAPADGIVTKATHITIVDPSPFMCGQSIEIEHTGLADGFATRYCHLGQVHVNYGDTVKRGQVMATVGQCGKGPRYCSYHLHFEVTEGFTRHDPLTKIAGCRRDETIELTRERPLIYPVKC